MNATTQSASLALTLLAFTIVAAPVRGQDNVTRAAAAADQRGDVLLTCDFETDDWWKAFKSKRQPENTLLVSGDQALGGKGRSLQVTPPRGEHLGTSFAYKFREQLGTEL